MIRPEPDALEKEFPAEVVEELRKYIEIEALFGGSMRGGIIPCKKITSLYKELIESYVRLLCPPYPCSSESLLECTALQKSIILHIFMLIIKIRK